MSTLSFEGDVIVVTGAGGGMGRCHALELARRGARVIVNDLGGHPFGGGSDPGLAEQVVAEIRVSLNRILDRLPSIDISEEHHGSPSDRLYRYDQTSFFRGLTELHLDLTSARQER